MIHISYAIMDGHERLYECKHALNLLKVRGAGGKASLPGAGVSPEDPFSPRCRRRRERVGRTI